MSQEFTGDDFDVCSFLLVTDMTAPVMSVPATFEDAFKGIRAYLVEKILPSIKFWNLMIDYDLLLKHHVDEIKVFTSFHLYPMRDSCSDSQLDP